MEADRPEPNPAEELDARMLTFNTALGTEYDSAGIQAAFSDIEVSVTAAAQQGLRGPVETFEAIRELSSAVSEVATANGDDKTAKIFKAKSASAEATRALLAGSTTSASEPAPQSDPVPERSAPKQRRRGTKSNTQRQTVDSRK